MKCSKIIACYKNVRKSYIIQRQNDRIQRIHAAACSLAGGGGLGIPQGSQGRGDPKSKKEKTAAKADPTYV